MLLLLEKVTIFNNAVEALGDSTGSTNRRVASENSECVSSKLTNNECDGYCMLNRHQDSIVSGTTTTNKNEDVKQDTMLEGQSPMPSGDDLTNDVSCISKVKKDVETFSQITDNVSSYDAEEDSGSLLCNTSVDIKGTKQSTTRKNACSNIAVNVTSSSIPKCNITIFENDIPMEAERNNVTAEETIENNVTTQESRRNNVTSPRTRRNNATSPRTRRNNVTSQETRRNNVTSQEARRNNVTSHEPQGNNVTSQEARRNNVTSHEPQGNNVTSQEDRRNNVTSQEAQGNNVTSQEAQGNNITSQETRRNNITSQDAGRNNVTSHEPQGNNITSTSQEAQGNNITSQEARRNNITSQEAHGNNITSQEAQRYNVALQKQATDHSISNLEAMVSKNDFGYKYKLSDIKVDNRVTFHSKLEPYNGISLNVEGSFNVLSDGEGIAEQPLPKPNITPKKRYLSH